MATHELRNEPHITNAFVYMDKKQVEYVKLELEQSFFEHHRFMMKLDHDAIKGVTITGHQGQIDLAEWLTSKISSGRADYYGDIWFNLYLSGGLALKGVFEFSEKEKEVKLEAPTTIVLGVELGLKAEVSVKTVSIKGETTQTVKAGVSGEAKTSVGFGPSIGYNSNEGMFLGFKVTFGGLVVIVSGGAKYAEKRDGLDDWSIGIEKEKKFILINEFEIWKGTLYPFKKISN